jgi:amino acid permease
MAKHHHRRHLASADSTATKTEDSKAQSSWAASGSGRRHANSDKRFLSMTAAATYPQVVNKGGEATVASSTFNLAKSIIGAGVLSLPSGIAFFADQPAAVIPASIICAVMGLVAAYTFSLIGRACEQHNATSFQDVWAKSVNPKTAWIISTATTAKCALGALSYSIIIGDTFTALANTFGLPAVIAQRSNVILLITSLVLLPLCSLKSLNALSPFSLLGLSGTVYTAWFMAVRYFDKSYAVGGTFFSTIAKNLQPSFNTRPGGVALNHLSLVLISMLSTSFISHYNAPRFYSELKDAGVQRFNRVTVLSFLASILTYIFIMSIGYLTFGGASSGFILNNYSGSDVLASIARLCVGLTLLTGYPFAISGLREGVLDMQGITDASERAKRIPQLTTLLIAVITGLALVFTDVAFVSSFGGAALGTFLMFIVPAIMHISNITRDPIKTPTSSSSAIIEKIANHGIIIGGGLLSILGCTVSVLKLWKVL